MSTISLQEVYGDDAVQVNSDSAAALKALPAEAWPALVEACEDRGCKKPGIDCKVARAHQTLEDFEESQRDSWRKRGCRSTKDYGVYPAVIYERMQPFKGARHDAVVVIDLGPCRAVLTCPNPKCAWPKQQHREVQPEMLRRIAWIGTHPGKVYRISRWARYRVGMTLQHCKETGGLDHLDVLFYVEHGMMRLEDPAT